MPRFLASRMAAVFVASACAGLALGGAPLAAADPVPGPPYVERTEWAHQGDLSSLRVYPSPAGRAAAGQVDTLSEGDEAWTEVLALSPDADLPGMRAQFMCHWNFAEFAQPGKPSWNLEPWRPVVDDAAMVDARCNPGGSEEPF